MRSIKLFTDKRILIAVIFINILTLIILIGNIDLSAGIDTGKDIVLSYVPEYDIITGKEVSVWPVNTLLEQGKAAYFYAAGPKLIFRPVISVNGNSIEGLSGTIKNILYIKALDDKGLEYFSKESVSNVENMIFERSSGKYMFAPGQLEVFVPDLYILIKNITDELGLRRAVFRVEYFTEINISAEINEESISKSLSSVLNITLGEDSFTMEKTTDKSLDIKIYSAPVINKSLFDEIMNNKALLGINIFIFIVVLYLLFSNIKAGSFNSKKVIEKMKFKEWITEGSVRTDDRLIIEVRSLEGIVDLAIDMDKRVIYDPDRQSYYVLEDTLAYVFDESRRGMKGSLRTDRLGSILINKGYITAGELEIGLIYQQKFNLRLGESLIALNFIDEHILHQTLAKQAGLTFVELDPEDIDYSSKWFSKLTYSQLVSFEAIPLGETKDSKLVIASSNPYGRRYTEILSELFDVEVELIAACPSDVYMALESYQKVYPEKKIPGYANEEEQKNDADLFRKEFEKGIIRNDILLKHMGLIETDDRIIFENNIRHLVGKLKIDAGLAVLVLGIEQSVKAFNGNLPDVPQLLHGSGFISDKDYEMYISNVSDQSKREEIILKNHLAARHTMDKAREILAMFQKLLDGE